MKRNTSLRPKRSGGKQSPLTANYNRTQLGMKTTAEIRKTGKYAVEKH
ncbi:MAG: hypothetical protein KME30_26275 [Iphinoe sp. HA4291-MV1]|nr:hypothetical protein [Iphinoe sp. HA4291-MV1]